MRLHSSHHRLLIATVLWALLARGPAARAAEPAAPAAPAAASQPAEPGWRLLFDGHTTNGWRGFRQPGFPAKGWVIEDGILKKVPRVPGGDLVTLETFEEFELRWEWRLPARANSGLKYFILEERGAAVGHEYQMIDDAIAGNPKTQTGAFYDVLPPVAGHTPPRINDWNESRIVVEGQRVEHWLNGEKILEYTLDSPAVREGVARSKFKAVPGFGTRVKGRILLTDHHDEAWFRNLRIRVPER